MWMLEIETVKVADEALVKLSLLDTPVSLPEVRSGVPGASTGRVSTTNVPVDEPTAVPASVTLAARS